MPLPMVPFVRHGFGVDVITRCECGELASYATAFPLAQRCVLTQRCVPAGPACFWSSRPRTPARTPNGGHLPTQKVCGTSGALCATRHWAYLSATDIAAGASRRRVHDIRRGHCEGWTHELQWSFFPRLCPVQRPLRFLPHCTSEHPLSVVRARLSRGRPQ